MIREWQLYAEGKLGVLPGMVMQFAASALQPVLIGFDPPGDAGRPWPIGGG